MSRRPDQSQWASMCAEVLDLAGTLTAGGSELLRRAKEESFDGYPSGSGGGVGQKGRVSNPTLAAVISRIEGDAHDPVWRNANVMCSGVLAAVVALREAVSALRNSDPVDPDVPGRKSQVEDCVNCGEPALPRPRAGRCEPCYRYRLKNAGADRRPA